MILYPINIAFIHHQSLVGGGGEWLLLRDARRREDKGSRPHRGSGRRVCTSIGGAQRRPSSSTRHGDPVVNTVKVTSRRSRGVRTPPPPPSPSSATGQFFKRHKNSAYIVHNRFCIMLQLN